VGVLADNHLKMKQQRTLAADKASCTGCITTGVASSPGKWSFTSSRPLAHCIRVLCPVWDSQHNKEMDVLKTVQGRATRSVRELENLPCVERLQDLSSSSLKKRRFQGDFIAA